MLPLFVNIGVRLGLLLCILLLPYGARSSLAGEVSQEYQLKAAFLFNFARFTTWPETVLPKKSVLNICIIGENPFDTILSNLEKKKIAGHPVKIHYLPPNTPTPPCHLAFYGKNNAGKNSIAAWKASKGFTLTVSDINNFASLGGDIEFIRSQNRIKFIINNTSLKEKGLQPRASLLELAAEIR